MNENQFNGELIDLHEHNWLLLCDFKASKTNTIQSYVKRYNTNGNYQQIKAPGSCIHHN